MPGCLKDLRERIDRIDEGLVELLAERMECAGEVIRYKNSVRDEARELEVLERIQRIACGRIDKSDVDSVFRRIIRASIEHQMEIVQGEKKSSEFSAEEPAFGNQVVAVIGTGSMGSWLASVLASQCPVAIYDSDTRRMLKVGGVRNLSAVEDLREFDPTILINAVSLEGTEEVFKDVVPHVKQGCILVDIMSVKGNIKHYYRCCGRPFVSVHPMFGPAHANMVDLNLENAVIISESDTDASVLMERFFRDLGINVHYLTFREHDEEMARSLTLPFVASIVFAASLEPGGVPGTTFTRHKLMARRLFMENDYLLAEILFNNHSSQIIGNICMNLEYLKHIMYGREYELAIEYFEKLRRKVNDDRA
jgi:prephenate dehydrogenase